MKRACFNLPSKIISVISITTEYSIQSTIFRTCTTQPYNPKYVISYFIISQHGKQCEWADQVHSTHPLST